MIHEPVYHLSVYHCRHKYKQRFVFGMKVNDDYIIVQCSIIAPALLCAVCCGVGFRV